MKQLIFPEIEMRKKLDKIEEYKERLKDDIKWCKILLKHPDRNKDFLIGCIDTLENVVAQLECILEKGKTLEESTGG